MYQVFQHGMVLGTFPLFCDAWLFASLELSAWSTIKGPEGVWNVDPLYDPSKPTIH
jgi:hypothetical protein